MNTENEQQKLSILLMDIGEKLIEAGAEISRVEDTLKRVGRAYGAVHMNVFVITSTISLTISFPDERMVTHSRRINHSADTDFHVLEGINELSRECVAGQLSMEQFSEKLREVTAPQKNTMLYIGSVVATFSFCIFFQGTAADAFVAAILGLGICRFQRCTAGVFPNRVMYFLITSFLTGIAASVMTKLIPGLHLDRILIGDIMLLTPGIAITNAMRDAFVGDTISGSMKLIEGVIWAGAIACGIMAAIWMVRV